MKNFKNTNFCVDFIGQSGSGKSTIIHLVCDSINKKNKLLGNKCCVSKDVSYFQYFQVLQALLHSPKLLKYYRLICKNSRFSIPVYLRWILLIAKHSWCKNSIFLRNDNIVLFDEGLVHHLPKWGDNIPVKFLSSCPLPDMVIQLKTSPIQAIRRKFERSKLFNPYKIKKGNRRFEKALQYAKIFLKEQKKDDAFKFIKDWSNKFCYPCLTDCEVHYIINHAKCNDIYHKKSLKIYKIKNLQSSLRNMGIIWFEVDTSDDFSIDYTVNAISKIILKHYQNFSFHKNV